MESGAATKVIAADSASSVGSDMRPVVNSDSVQGVETVASAGVEPRVDSKQPFERPLPWMRKP